MQILWSQKYKLLYTMNMLYPLDAIYPNMLSIHLEYTDIRVWLT